MDTEEVNTAEIIERWRVQHAEETRLYNRRQTALNVAIAFVILVLLLTLSVIVVAILTAIGVSL